MRKSHEISSGPKSITSHCVAKSMNSLIRKSWNSQKSTTSKMTIRPLKSTTSHTETSTRTPKKTRIPWGHLRRTTPTSYTQPYLGQGPKGIKESSQRPYKRDMSSRNLIRISFTNHIHTMLHISRVLQHHTTSLYHLYSTIITTNPKPTRTTEPSKSHNSNWVHGTSRHSSTPHVLTYCKTWW